MLTQTVSGRAFTYSHCIGRLAQGGTGLRFIMDVALAPGGIAYVLNRSSEAYPHGTRVTKLALGGQPLEEELILEFGCSGSGDGEFQSPTSVALDQSENAYVADEWLNQIVVFDKGGNFLKKWGISGDGEGHLNRPWGLAFDAEDTLWVVNSANSRIQRFTKEGKFLTGWGAEGSGEGEFNIPWGIAIDQAGDVYVADWRNSRVQKLTPDGRFMMAFGSPGSGTGELRRPSDVEVDGEGDVYVSDWAESRVNAYGPDGTYLATFVGDAHQLSKWGAQTVNANPDTVKARNRVKSLEPERRLSYPTTVETNDNRQIVIGDQQRNRIQIYIKEKDYVEPQFNL